ncbi:MAG: hypothetical protein QOH90_1519 [Actinomycetota bacterium]|nr:hypothetical protein [Actinomycetota bacterium]
MADLLTMDRLIVNQKAKLVELTNQYHIRDEQGNDVGLIQQEGQSTLRKVLRFATKVDQFLTHHLAVTDMQGNRIIELTRPSKVFKSRLEVRDGTGRAVGEIVQKNVFGKIRFDLVAADDSSLGQIRAENWRAWNFAIVDTSEREIGRITKKFVGVLKGVFTTADNYIVDISPEVTGDLRLMVLAAAAGVDTALKQDDRGFSLTDGLD